MPYLATLGYRQQKASLVPTLPPARGDWHLRPAAALTVEQLWTGYPARESTRQRVGGHVFLVRRQAATVTTLLTSQPRMWSSSDPSQSNSSHWGCHPARGPLWDFGLKRFRIQAGEDFFVRVSLIS
jgi:hypothetical protein